MNDDSTEKQPRTNEPVAPGTLLQQGRPSDELLGETSLPPTSPVFASDSSVVPPHPPEGYELLAEIGHGGMGVVYRARDKCLNRDVAVKMLHPRYAANSPAARRFLEEAQITGQLQHPGIPPVHEVGQLPDGRPFLAMKLIKGRTLAESLESGAESSGSLIAAFEQVCQAVAYAHNHGVIHRDLKPANVMVGAFGEVQVMDWGLAKFRNDARAETVEAATASTFHDPRADTDEQQRTSAGTFLGTPAYMSPEQGIGAVDRLDERSDVFGLGGILCVILTGKPPFAAENAEAARQMAADKKLDDAYARLDACDAGPELVSLCKRCLSAEKANRPKHAGEVASAVAALRAAADDRAKKAGIARAQAEVQAAEQRKRRKVQLALAGAVLLLVTAGGAFAWWQARQAREREVVANQFRDGVRTNLALATDLRGQAKFKAAAAALAQAAELARSGAPELLAGVEHAQAELAFVVRLDEIQTWYPSTSYNVVVAGTVVPVFQAVDRKGVPSKYHIAFADSGLDLAVLDPAEAAARIASSAIRNEILESIDDWALNETDEVLRDRLLQIARRADPHPWRDRLRDPVIRKDRAEVKRLHDEVDPSTASPHELITLSTLMPQTGLDPVPLLTDAHARFPGHFRLAFRLGMQLRGSKDGREIGPLEAARALRPDNWVVWNNLGVALLRRGDSDGATATFRQAIVLEPNIPWLHNHLGGALSERGDHRGAIAACNRAIELNPTWAAAHVNLGNALMGTRDLPGAIASFKYAIQLDPTDADIHTNLAAALQENGDPDGAIAACRESLRLDPRGAKANLNLGSALLAKKDPEGAIDAFQEAIRLDPNFALAHLNLGAIYRRQQRYPEMADCARAAIQANPRLSQGHTQLGFALWQLNDITGSRAAYLEAGRLDPNLKKWQILPPIPVAPLPREVMRP